MKKRLCALLCLLLLLSAFPLPAAAEEGEPPASVPHPQLAVTCSRPDADTAAVTVSLKNSPGIAGFDVELQLNSTVNILTDPVISLGEAWDPAKSVNAIDLGNESIRVCCVNDDDVGEPELFTVTFRVAETAFDTLLFFARGEFCDRDSKAVAVDSPEEWEPLFGDRLAFCFSVDTMLAMNTAGVSGTMSLEIHSYDSGLGKGVGYSGNARLLLACYQNGKFCGCKMQNVTVRSNQCTEIQMTNVSFPVTDPEGVCLKLMLLDDRFVPLMCADSSVPLQG